MMFLGQSLALECHSLIPMPSISMNLPSLDGYSNLEWLGEGWACCWWIRHRGFGDVFKAVDEMSSDYVALKRIRRALNTAQLQSESALLKGCNSKFIVRYITMIPNENEYWVWFVCCCWWNRSWWSIVTVDLYMHSFEVEIGWMRVNCARLRAVACLDCSTFTTVRLFTGYGVEEWTER